MIWYILGYYLVGFACNIFISYVVKEDITVELMAWMILFLNWFWPGMMLYFVFSNYSQVKLISWR